MLHSKCLTFWTLSGKVEHILKLHPILGGFFFGQFASHFSADRQGYAPRLFGCQL
jgi:hypothetical protein